MLMWQQAPPEDYYPTINLNFADVEDFADAIRGMIRYDRPVLTSAGSATYLATNYEQGRFGLAPEEAPRSYLLHPVYDNLLTNRKMVAFLSAYVE